VELHCHPKRYRTDELIFGSINVQKEYLFVGAVDPNAALFF